MEVQCFYCCKFQAIYKGASFLSFCSAICLSILVHTNFVETCYGRWELVCGVLTGVVWSLILSWCWSHVNKVNHTCPVILTPVVQKLDSAIHRINLHPVDNANGFPTYPLDSDLSGGWRYPTFEQLGPGLSSLCILVSYDNNFLGSLSTLRCIGNLLQKYILKCYFPWNIHPFRFHEVWQKCQVEIALFVCVVSLVFCYFYLRGGGWMGRG